MFGNSYYNNPYLANQQMQQMQQPVVQPQMIQTINQYKPQSICYFVSNKDELQQLQIDPATMYIGINKQAKEIYVRCFNSNGLIDFETYSLSNGEQQPTELKTILSKLQDIENKLKEKENVSTTFTTNNVGSISKPSNDGGVQSNDVRKNSTATNRNFTERS